MVISGPSCVGKSTLLRRLLREYPGQFQFPVSPSHQSAFTQVSSSGFLPTPGNLSELPLRDASHRVNSSSIPCLTTYRPRRLLRSHCNIANHISIPTLPPTPRRHPTRMSFRYVDARNLKNKSSYFFNYFSGHNPDVVAITETFRLSNMFDNLHTRRDTPSTSSSHGPLIK